MGTYLPRRYPMAFLYHGKVRFVNYKEKLFTATDIFLIINDMFLNGG